jgi:hypothetical protein
MRPTFCCLLTALTAFAAPNPGEEGTPEFEKAAALVKQLGHPRFAVREAAGKKLLEMGGSAAIALHAGTKSDDEEVRTRCAALLPQAKATEWRRRADAYLADAEGKAKHDLPLLGEWEKLTGKPDAGSRKVFADMVRTSGDLLDAAVTDPKSATTKVSARAREIIDRVTTAKGQVKAEPGELAAVLFVDVAAGGTGPTAGARRVRRERPTSPAQLLANPAWPDALGAADIGPALRKLLVKWAGVHPVNDFVAHQQFALLVQKKPFAEAAPVLAATARNKDADLLSVRLLAVQALGKVGGKEATDTLTDLIADGSVLFGGQDEHRLGDSALAALVQMSGKKLSDYGLTNNFGIGFASGPGEEPIMLQIHGFRTTDDRTKAVKKWKDQATKKDDTGKKDK